MISNNDNGCKDNSLSLTEMTFKGFGLVSFPELKSSLHRIKGKMQIKKCVCVGRGGEGNLKITYTCTFK